MREIFKEIKNESALTAFITCSTLIMTAYVAVLLYLIK